MPERRDYECERHGTANLFVAVGAPAGRRWVRLTERRTGADLAERLRLLAEVGYPEAQQIVLVAGDLNTRPPACLYEASEPTPARRIAQTIAWHYTPEQGSRLNVAEIALSVLWRPCLWRRIDEAETPSRAVAAWERARNARQARIVWQFTPEDARVKLRRLYPVVKEQTAS